MLFNSSEFIFVFLPIAVLLYFFLNQRRLVTAGKAWLVLASLIFYSYWNAAYLPLILIMIAINFTISGKLIAPGAIKQAYRKPLLISGILFNISLLGYFKYYNFIIDNISFFSGTAISGKEIILPLAISFITFQQIAFLVDSYKGKIKENSFLNYLLFITFFPQLIAGPIVHHSEMMPQLNSKWNLLPKYKNVLTGIAIFSLGLFKKVVIADSFAIWANSGFANSASLDFVGSWVTSLSYTFQLYFDFSGYCDMAIGAALIFNIKLPLNFNSPYKSLDIQDFWRRWHITLGRFLRDYIYIPLGGNRGTDASIYSNLFITFVVGGLWHGASWMFVIWGALHGIALIIHRLWKKFGGNMPNPLAWLATFLFVNFTWVFFRAEDLESAANIIHAMTGSAGVIREVSFVPTASLAWLGGAADVLISAINPSIVAYALELVAIIAALAIISLKNSMELSNQTAIEEHPILLSLIFSSAAYAMLSSSSAVFLYFNF